MQTVGIKALQTNPSVLGQAFDRGDYLLITRRGKPIGVAAAFDDSLLDLGFRNWLTIRAFQAGDLSLGQVAQIFEKPRDATMRMLANLGIPIADYDLTEDLDTLNKLGDRTMDFACLSNSIERSF